MASNWRKVSSGLGFGVLLLVGANAVGLGAPLLRAQAAPLAGADYPRVLDLLRVPADGDAAQAVVALAPGPEQKVTCDVVIVGGGMGGVSAAYQAAWDGLQVCLTEPTLWIGGQMTSEGVSAFDENDWIRTTGATATYTNLSNRILSSYRAKIASAGDKVNSDAEFNPGNCWVSRLCFEPSVGLEALQGTLEPLVAAGRIRIWLHTVPVKVTRRERRIQSVEAYDFEHRQWLRLQSRFFIDASEWGDLIRLSGLPFRVGAEARSETGERDAPDRADPGAVQSFTYPFILRDGKHSPPLEQIGPVPGYASLKSKYSLTVDYGPGKLLTYGVFADRPGLPGSFWSYRRSVDAGQFRPGAFAGDLAMINWSGNDYCDARLLSDDPIAQAEALQGAKRLSLGFARWLQNDVERDDGTGKGYPWLTLETAAMGSRDGLSQQPYIRESRRIVALRTVVEEDISVDFQKGPRAALYPDSVGIGQYPIDSHSCGRSDFGSSTKPFEIPLGALIARDADNLLAASKNIGTTHISNGAYRLHPTEWSIGEAAGAAVAWAAAHNTTPLAMDSDPSAIAALQQGLLRRGHPVFWFDDVTPGSPWFAAAQSVSARGWLAWDASSLHVAPGATLDGGTAVAAMQRAGVGKGLSAEALQTLQGLQSPTWENLLKAGLRTGSRRGAITRGEFAIWLLDRAEFAK